MTNIIKTEEKVTYELMLKEHGEGYIKNDNRTHTGALMGRTPSQDILCHMSIVGGEKDVRSNSSVVSSLMGSFLGHSSVELTTAALDKVFHFPTSKMFKKNVLEITKQKMNTLYPQSMIERFNLGDNVCYSQKTPIFFCVQSNNFFIAMDERFLEDITFNEVIEMVEDRANIDVFEEKRSNRKFLVIKAKTIPLLLKEMALEDSAFSKLIEGYKQRFLNMANTERVIVVKYEIDKNDLNGRRGNNQFTAPNYSDKNAVAKLTMSQKMEMVIFQAAKLNNTYYLISEEGIINPKAILFFKDEETETRKIKAQKDYLRSDYSEEEKSIMLQNNGHAFLVIGYTEEDWNFIKGMHLKLRNLCEELESFLLSTKTTEGLPDKSFSEGKMGNLGTKLLK